MYLKSDHTYSTVDLFRMFRVEKLKGKGKIARTYKLCNKKALAQKIFLRFLYLLLEDLTDGKHIFYFSSAKTAAIRVRKISGEEFKKMRRKGYFKDVDFLVSNFSAYILVMDYFTKGNRKMSKSVIISKQFKDKMIQKTNQGYIYC